MAEYAGYKWEQDADGIVTITMDDPDSSVNTMNEHFVTSLAATVERLESSSDSYAGVILASAKKSWFAGGDLNQLRAARVENSAEEFAQVEYVKSLLRRLEKLGKPVVAVMNGTALGGGLEVALACGYRIAASDAPGAQFGLPEVSLGLLPGGGGITRTVRMLGLEKALTEVILPATKFSASGALDVGLVDEVVPASDMVARAKAWIAANPAPVKPWDEKGFRLPGGGVTSPAIAANLPAMPALLRKQTGGAPMPAPRAALAAAVEGAYVDFDTSSTVESRYFVNLTHTAVAKNMIKAFFFDLQQISSGASRPAGFEKSLPSKVGVIGAGMMGAGIAYVTARAGIDVVLLDVSDEAAEKGKDYARSLEEKALARGKTTAEKSAALLDRITTTSSDADLAGVDFVIEAVFEDAALKQSVFARIESAVAPDAVLGSNTSTLPITQLATAVSRPEDFIGIHFFSPVDKMPLVEIVRGASTGDAVLAKVFDYVLAIRKTPIVVNDSRGFFTSRVIGTFMNEALAMVGEGIAPASIEQAAVQAGYPVGALQLGDELTLTLSQRIRGEARAAIEAEGGTWESHPADAVLDWMIESGRTGRKAGGGFYDYDADGKRGRIWPGLLEHFASGSASVPFEEMQERMLFIESLETVRCFDEGVLTSVADANIGSIYGIGYPAWTGGVLQYINQYEGGVAGFVARANELADTYGERFRPPASLVERAASGAAFE